MLAALAAGAAWWKWQQYGSRTAPLRVPQIERPRVAPPQTPDPVGPPAPPPEPATVSHEPLQITLEPLRFSLTLRNATLAYRLEIANHGPAPLTGLRIEADMISAHASLPGEQHLAGPDAGAPSPHVIERLEQGENRILEGEFRLPFPQIVPMRQGEIALLLPLARFRVVVPGAEPVVRTFAVGQPGASGMQPFRLDLGPRVYPQLVQRAFGPVYRGGPSG
ncbi:MAG: hypothetical protein ABIP24_03810 [Croceibacterium sp.]